MSITQRLSIAFSLLSAALIALVIASLIVISGFQARFQYVQDNAIASIIDLNQLIDGSNELIIWLYRHQSATDLSRQAEVEKEINARIDKLNTLNQHYLENDISSDEDRRMTEAAFTRIKTIQSQLPAFLAGSRAQNDAISLGQLQGPDGLGASIRSLITAYQKQLQLNVDIGAGLKEENAHIYHLTFWGLLLGSGLVITLLGLFTVMTITGIRKNLAGIRNVMETASSRLDLTLLADESRKDEVGLTAKAFNQLLRSMASSLSAVSTSSHSVSTASTQIAAGTENLSSRTEEQAASLEQTAASMSELSETVRQTAENTRMASQLSQNALVISGDSTRRVREMQNTMSEIRHSSTKITDIIALIEGIAFQTNILALNAAVEAARAGEQGRGFAVVAGEVRSLAQRASTSAKEIKSLIESSMSLVEAGSVQAEDVGRNMDDMNNAVRQVSDLVNEIAAAAQEQDQGISQVHQAVNQMDDVTQQNAALVEQASAACRSLMEQSETLTRCVAGFIIDKTPPSSTSGMTQRPPQVVSEKTIEPSFRTHSNSDADWQHF